MATFRHETNLLWGDDEKLVFQFFGILRCGYTRFLERQIHQGEHKRAGRYQVTALWDHTNVDLARWICNLQARGEGGVRN